MKLLFKIMLLVFFIANTVSGQEAGMQFTLDEALNYALENNKTLKNAKADVGFASAQIKEARGSGLPQVDGSVDYMTNFNYSFELDFGAGASPPIVMEDQASANVQVTQLIFSGQYWVGLQMAKLGMSIRETSLVKTENDVKEQVTNAYYLILVTKNLLKVISENAKNMGEIYEHTNNMYKAGLAEQTDADQIKVNLSQLENSKKEMERNLQLNYNMFRLLLGIESNENITLRDSLEYLVEAIASEYSGTEEFDVNENPDYQLMTVQEELGNKQVAMQKWAYAPSLAGYYSYKEKILTSGFDLSPKNAAGLTLSVPIFSGGTRQAQLSQKRIELEQIERNKNLLEEQLQLQDKQLTYEMKSAYDNYLIQKENVDVASRVYKSFQNKYKQGFVSSLELTQANSNYLQAESNYISAVMKLLQSKLALDKLYNKI